jgi:diguanylate cyclase (GGDEF)-like protein
MTQDLLLPAAETGDSGRGPRRSPARLAALFLVLVCVSLSAVQGWSIYSARRAALNESRVATLNMARAMADHAEGLFDQVDSVLASVVEQVEHDGLGSQRARLQHYLTATASREGAIQDLFIYDADGRWVLNSLEHPPPGAPLNNADREYFDYHRTHAELGTRVGVPVRSRSRGVLVIPVSRRLQRADGSFAGVVLATVAHDYFRNYFERIDIGDEGVIMLGNDDGRLIMRRPASEPDLEHGAPADTLLTLLRQQGPTGNVDVTGRDGVARHFAYEHLRRYPLLVGVGVSQREVLERWRRSAWLGGAGAGALLLALVLLGGSMIRQLVLRDRLQQALRTAKRELEASNDSLRAMALSDGLTGLPNRRHFDQRLEQEFKRAMRDGSALALIMLDVDYFKRYNDRYGHVAGDACLQAVAKAISSSLRRPADLAARFGGEEFAILLPDTGSEGAIAVAEAARQALLQRAIEHNDNPGRLVTLSAGVAVLRPQRGQSSRRLIEAADEGLYEAKGQGRNRVVARE